MPNLRLPIVCALVLVVLSVATQPRTAIARHPPAEPVRVDVDGFKLNSILIPGGSKADLPPIVFLHGASASLYDPMLSFRQRLQGRAELLFVDRPGHGGSDAGGKENILPSGQADAIARLMERRGIKKAIIVGHSFGGATAAALALRHPEKVLGLVFLSPAVYPWKTGVAWYYGAASAPVTGQIFSAVVAPAVGIFAIDKASAGVFAPNPRPADYVERTRAFQALRPDIFRHNAQEVKALSDWATTAAAGYRKIKAPTVIISGDADQIVSPDIHAKHLARDIRGSQLIMVHNLGHKSDFVAGDLAVAAIERVAGQRVDLKAAESAVERRIANDGKD